MTVKCTSYRHAEMSAKREGCTDCRDAKEAWLKERGWSQYYNPAYWVHPKTIENPAVQDFTNYGLSLERAVTFEASGEKPFQSVGQIGGALSALYQPGYKGV